MEPIKSSSYTNKTAPNANDREKIDPGGYATLTVPAISLPKGGGAIKGIEEKFQVNALTGTSSFSIPIPLSPSRHGAVPAMGLSYNSGNGNSPFGLGWQLAIPSISRKTGKILPQYNDQGDGDTFLLSGVEDLVPLLEKQNDGAWKKYRQTQVENGITYTIKRYRPRIEGPFARIEKWENTTTGETHWRTVTSDNVHSYYGLTAESRIADPADTTRVFEWLLCKTHDDKGNLSLNYFKPEDFLAIDKKGNEKNRLNNCTQTYLKKVLYGNKTPYYPGDAIPAEEDFLFKVVLDYGEHDTAENIAKDIYLEKKPWSCRKDPFSDYRAGFEIRTYRRCNRVLIFHCFDELPNNPYLAKSLQLFYDDELKLAGNNNTVPGFSFLVKARQNGHLWDETKGYYTTKYLPETEIQYQPHEWNTEIVALTPGNSAHVPAGLSDKSYLWIDLYSEGISGILTEKANGWLYKSNLGQGNFSEAMPVAPKPSLNGLGNGSFSIQELEGNGVKYLVQYDNEPKGFYKFNDDNEWEPMKNFQTLPLLNVYDANMRMLDLNGDGIADMLITEDDQLRWYPGLGEKGFDVSRTVTKYIEEEKGPAIVFADRDQSIFLADMSGDGLTDIVRIRNGEIVYWPNLGYGKFGARVNMDNAPFFDNQDSFNPSFLRLADIDGSGTTDVIYLGKNDFRVWMNVSGNEWTVSPQIINAFPMVDNVCDVAVLDFLGTGTACIVYSSPIGNASMQYIDLMGSKKPGLFTGYKNNCGKEVNIEYRSSAWFYLQDKLQDNPWITKLPFPVHCISKVTSTDKIRQTVFTSTYRYRHGYFDHEEKEYRGFARVEQLDTEDFQQFRINNAKNVVEEDLHQPPVRTISWFHTGAFIRSQKILHQLESEYFINNAFAEYHIPEPVLPNELNNEEIREAYRACKGLPLRVETYANDNTPQANFPYSTSQSTIQLDLVQPAADNPFASFLVTPAESVSYHYDRNPADPRIDHSFTLQTDEQGNVTQSASVVYPRVARPQGDQAIPDKVWEQQNKMHIVYGETTYTNDVITNDAYRLRATCESRSYEINGIAPAASFYYNKAELQNEIAGTALILFEEEFNGTAQKRLSAHTRQYYYKDDLSGPLPLGQLSAIGLVCKLNQLAFTKNLAAKYYGSKVTDQMFQDARYVHSEGDEHWWTQPGEYIYAADPKTNFYIPVGARDVFGNESHVEMDVYHLLVNKTTDALDNFSTAVNDYRTLSPVLLTDANRNRAAVQTDELGMVIKSAVMGKEGAGEGDTLDDPTAKMDYNLFNWQNNGKPNFAHASLREQHGAANTRWQESYVYTDGGGNVIMTKAQVNPGIAKKWDVASQQVIEINANPRWVGNGRTILNNKGNPVKQYEPYFSSTFEYESEDALVETGVTPVLYYDPVGRNIKTDYPNGTFTKTVFDAWKLTSFDANDTVKDSQWYIDRGSPDANDAEPADAETRAAWLAARHYNTPGIAHTDSLARTIYTIADYGNGKTTALYSETDTVQRYAKAFDQIGRNISEGYVNMLGQPIYGKTAEKGERWVFTDVIGRLVKIWDNALSEVYASYDRLHRPVSTFVKQNGQETLLAHVVYGDLFSNDDAIAKNMKGRPLQVYDQSGVVTVTGVDFKGNVTSASRQLTKEYRQLINWSVLDNITDIPTIQTNAAALLETETFTSSAIVDALGRPVTVTLPDNSVLQPTYNEGNLLTSLDVKIMGQSNFVNFLAGQDYDAKGQRQFVQYGNQTITSYFYDPQTFRLVNLITRLHATDAGNESVQDLQYHHDPIGNITQLRDDAQQTHFFSNTVVYPENKYEYDAIYQLTKATGRELAGAGNSDTQRNNTDLFFVNQLPHQNNATAVRNYIEQYDYDDCGNIKQLKHIAANANFTQRYQYAYETDATNNTNRLQATSLPGDAAGVFSAVYTHDGHGNMTSMPHLAAANSLQWNCMDQLSTVNLGGGGIAYYVYGTGGNRCRKVIERQGGLKTERIYLGAVEIYRESRGGNAPDLERYTLHISDNTGKIAQVDTKTIDTQNADTINPLNVNNIRYQYGNHLGSAMLETDGSGNIISYEEYHPYGTSSYRVCKAGTDLSMKRYRFSGKEKDDETGFYYFGARYYAAWLGRWTSSDPAGFVDGANLYTYCRNNSIVFHDKNGNESSSNKDLENDFYIKEGGNTKQNPAFEITGKFTSIGSSEYAQYKNEKWGLVWVKIAEEGPEGATLIGPRTPMTDKEFQDLEKKSKESKGEGSNGQDGGKSPSKAPVPSALPDSTTHAGPGLEKGIWSRNQFDRGYTLEHLYNNNYKDAYKATRDNRANYDVETPTHVKQIKSNEGTNATQLRNHASKATRDAGTAISKNPTRSMAGKSPQAVVITPTDAPASAGADILAGYNNMRRPVPNATPPEQIRGVPGNAGVIGKGLTYGGTGLSAGFFIYDLAHGDYTMATADGISTVAGGLEIAAIASPGAAIAGVSAMSAGLALGGVGLALGSGIGAYRDFKAGNIGWGAVGVAGVLAGIAVTAGIIFSAPALVVGGLIAGAAVGLLQLGRWISSWF